MKRLYCLFSLFMLVLRLSAAPVTVSGHLLYTDGTPVADWPVFIGQPDLNGNANVAMSDSTGNYSIVVDLPAGDVLVEVQTFDNCTAQDVWVPIVNAAASADFILCSDPVWSGCWADAYTELQQNLAVQFHGNGYGPDSLAIFTYAWDFGDGTTSTEQNPVHTYANAGTYPVTLTVTSPDCSSSTTLLVAVFPVQNVTVSGQVTDQNGAGVPFWFVYVNSGDPAGQFYGGYTDPAGNYSIAANVPDSATTVTASTWDFCTPAGLTGTAPIVNGAAQINFQICYDSFPPAPLCGAYISYTNTDPADLFTFQFTANTYAVDSLATFTYAWDFGDGTTSMEQNPVHTFPQNGVYSVLLTVTSSTGCVAQACDVVCTLGGGTVDTFFYGCQAMFGVGWGGPNPAGGLDPLTVDFLDMSFGVATTWAWNFGDSTTSTEQNPSHTYAQSGLYTVTLHITTVDGCESEITMEIYVGDDYPWTEYDCQAMFLPIPDSTGAGFVFLDLSITQSPVQTWSWDFGDGTTSSEQNPAHTYAQPGVYTVTLSIEADSCSSMISFLLDTNNPFSPFNANGGVLGQAAHTTATHAVPAVDQLRAFPNPAVSELTVAFSSNKAQDVTLELSNLAGQTLRAQANRVADGPNAIRVPVQDLTPGLYLVQLRTADQVQSVKFVKE